MARRLLRLPACRLAITSRSIASFGFSATWAVSMGYYRAGHPVYATLSGLGRSALIAGGITFDRRPSCEECSGLPAATMLALAGAIVWGAIDCGRLDNVVRRDAQTSKPIAVLPVVTPAAQGVTLGLVGTY